MHDSFRHVEPAHQLTRQKEADDQSGEDVPLKRMAACEEDDIKTVPRLAQIPCYNYTESILDNVFVRWMEGLAFLLCT